MSTRTITSPGVEIRESDLSLIAPKNVGTNVFVTGFSQQGPIDEVLKITSDQELDQIYGVPTNSAERYFYHSIQELLNSPANVYTTRLPYGSGSGEGFGAKYSALVYPVLTVTDATSASQTVSIDLDVDDGVYVLGAPNHLELTEDEYRKTLEGSSFNWSSSASDGSLITNISAASGAGLIVLNKSQSTISSQFEGYYIAIGDNTNINPATNFDAFLGAKTVSEKGASVYPPAYTDIPLGTLQFNLSSETPYGPTNSISEIMENLTDYNIDGREDDDVISVGEFKLRKSIFATEAFKLDFVLENTMVGSVNEFRVQTNPRGGPVIPFTLETADSNSRNVEVLVNPYISNRFKGVDSIDASGLPRKKVRVLTNALAANTNTTQTGILSSTYASLSALHPADNIYALGAYSDSNITSKSLGDIPSKLDRSLQGVENDEIYDIDVVVEAGLGTVYAAASASQTTYYDEYAVDANLLLAVDGLRTSGDITTQGRELKGDYQTIFNIFEQFCSPPYDGGGRGDCIFIADPIRHICVTGKSSKVLDNKANNFQQHVYWAMRHQFENENTSYACNYGNWAQVYDAFSGRKVWVPFSGFAGATMARTDAARFPWIAPAGFTNGLVKFASDIAISPNQKQRDELYKANINPVAFFPSQGQVVFGQKTMSRKPSSFDRINVRRLFLALERPTKKACKFFVFEPNTEFTRTRLVNTLRPIFEHAKNNEGIYEYIIVCDERNNTAEVIDNNELVVDIYIKAVRAAEFIRVNFYSTRTDANFQELING